MSETTSVPIRDGYYWADCRKHPNWDRRIVFIGEGGKGHRRIWVPRFSSSFDLSDFTNFSPPT